MCYVSKTTNDKTSGDVKKISLILEIELEDGKVVRQEWDLDSINVDESRDFDFENQEIVSHGVSIDGKIKQENEQEEAE